MDEDARWTVALESDPGPELRAGIVAALRAANEAAAGPGGNRLLAVGVRDASGAAVGGLWGEIKRGFLFVELLALGPARSRGLGRQVMALAEAEARRRGLDGMWLHTWTFQAPGFYEKLGFTECGRIPGYPRDHDCIFYVKRFI